ncbi:MAG: ATP-binding protein [Polyangia bacterium]
MPIYRTTLVNFTVFERAEFEFSRGINVLIGKNGTGKSHLLKALYGMTEGTRRSYSERTNEPGYDMKRVVKLTKQQQRKEGLQVSDAEQIEGRARSAFVSAYLDDLFIPNDLGGRTVGTKLLRLGRRYLEQEIDLIVSCSFSQDPDEDEVVFMFEPNEEKAFSLSVYSSNNKIPPFLKHASVFLPPREVLTIYPGFTVLYQKRQISFDRTYYDLCQALALPLLRQPTQAFASMSASLETAIGGKIILRGDRFIIARESGEIDANLEAEGLRKLAMIAHLIANGSLEPGGYLFWDEPEANMNPKLVVLIKNLLVGLAKAGVQVFIATHDYLLCGELSLFSEYAEGEDKGLVKFFCLNKDKHTDPVSVESGAVLADLSHNPIVEEFTAHYEREAKMFAEKH